MDVPDPGAAEPTAVLVVRVWQEANGGFRARVTRVDDLSAGEEIVTVHATTDDVLLTVAAWLDTVVRPR